jgi:hypothetical protein
VSFDSEVRVGRAARLGELRNRDTSVFASRLSTKQVPGMPRTRPNSAVISS